MLLLLESFLPWPLLLMDDRETGSTEVVVGAASSGTVLAAEVRGARAPVGKLSSRPPAPGCRAAPPASIGGPLLGMVVGDEAGDVGEGESPRPARRALLLAEVATLAATTTLCVPPSPEEEEEEEEDRPLGLSPPPLICVMLKEEACIGT